MNIVTQLIGILIFILIYGAFAFLAYLLSKSVSNKESDEDVGENSNDTLNFPWRNGGEF